MKWFDVLDNRVLQAALFAWLIAQCLKVILVFWKEKRLDWSRMLGSGGMPSAHSAFVVAMAASVGKYTVVACVVMYDAANVRWEAGKQAELLNRIVMDIYRDNHLDQEKLKELLGHTPVEVAAGALLGIAVGVCV